MTALGLPGCDDTFEAVVSAYAQKHRHYHTEAHIDACLAQLDSHRELACAPHEIELALWFHDAVYKTRASDNEEKSAEWACAFLAGHGVAADVRERIRGLILATKHDAPAETADAKLLVDIDLAILGADALTYERFEQDVRQEYRWVPGPMFRRARAKILRSFLARDRIYATGPFHDRLERTARRNLETAIGNLDQAAPLG